VAIDHRGGGGVVVVVDGILQRLLSYKLSATTMHHGVVNLLNYVLMLPRTQAVLADKKVRNKKNRSLIINSQRHRWWCDKTAL
jgi:hypothetical protein